MTTLGDLAKRLYDTYADTTHKFEPLSFAPLNRWDDLSEIQQEVWVTVASEAVKVGVEIQQEIERQDDERLRNDSNLWVSFGQMQRGEGRVLRDCE